MSADDKAAAAWDDYVSQQQEEKIEQLERELNAANERIKRLEEESESRWLLAQSAVESCAEMSSRIQRLEEAGDGLLAALKDDWSEYVEWINESTDAVGKWNRAKESKQ